MSRVSLGHGMCTFASKDALRIVMQQDRKLIWIPKSVIHDDSEVYGEGHQGDVVVEEWWADKEGLSDIGKGTKR